jgi:carbon starvation protein
MGLLLLIISILVTIIAYKTYGTFIATKLGVDDSKTTPAHTMYDGVDYVPTKVPILLGHHFASIAGAGPIVGPIIALAYGWLPAYLWILIGVVFIGAVHDFASIFASIRHQGKSIGEIIENHLGFTGKRLFLSFSWATLILVVAVFLDVVAKTFIHNPSVATASILFIGIAFLFGVGLYKMNLPLGIITLGGVLLLALSIYVGLRFPIEASYTTWIIILIGYIFIASVLPVWVLLQPRDYLNSFLLYALILGALVGIFFYGPSLHIEAYSGFTNVNLGPLFPILFITVACGAISGFHSLVGSGTTSKQLDRETDAKKIGYGGMLIEGILAVIAIIAGATLISSDFHAMFAERKFIPIFAAGVSKFLASLPLLNISESTGRTFTSLAVAAFALTSLDTATRLARFAVQEFFEDPVLEKTPLKLFQNRYLATTLTVLAGAVLLLSGGALKLWPLFGSANQLLAALALLAVTVWLSVRRKENKYTLIPMIFMYFVTTATLILLIRKYIWIEFHPVLATIAFLLLILSMTLAVKSYQVMKNKDITKKDKQKTEMVV